MDQISQWVEDAKKRDGENGFVVKNQPGINKDVCVICPKHSMKLYTVTDGEGNPLVLPCKSMEGGKRDFGKCHCDICHEEVTSMKKPHLKMVSCFECRFYWQRFTTNVFGVDMCENCLGIEANLE